MDNNGFCTIVSKHKLYQAIALYNSLIKFVRNLRFYILCIDNETYGVLNKANLQNAELIKLEQVESKDLLEVKAQRSIKEYCWTLKPVFILYVLDNYNDIDMVTFVDSDIYFFSNPEPIYKNLESNSVWLTTHISDDTCNSGFEIFKKDKVGYTCLNWWREQCINWCSENVRYMGFMGKNYGIFGDQTYLDPMRVLFDGVGIINILGVHIAPWNDFKYIFYIKNGQIYINSSKMIFYHFGGFKIINKQKCIRTYGKYIPLVHDFYRKKILSIIKYTDKLK